VAPKGSHGSTASTRRSHQLGFSIYGLEFGDATSPLTQLVHQGLLSTGATVDETTWPAGVGG
jgi:hypothetical protein